MDFDPRRLRYLGYWKLNTALISDQAIRNDTSAGVTSKVPFPELFYNVQRIQDMSLLGNPAFLRGKAPRYLRDLRPEVADVTSTTAYTKDYLYEIAGIARSAVLHHDDFREDDGKPKPRIAVWLLEVPDPEGLSVTWVFLHGTADGNLGEYSMGEMPSTRAGSGTELFFEMLYLDAHEVRPGPTYSGLTPHIQARAAYGMLHDASTQPVEAVFRCYHVLDLAASEAIQSETRIPSFDLNLSDGRAAPVSRLIVGSPLAVQLRSRVVKIPLAVSAVQALLRIFGMRARPGAGELARRAIHTK